jgi:5-methylcytosine-specific restriction endonuclease McrA
MLLPGGIMSVYYTTEELSLAVSKSICWSDVCRELNITICSHNYKKAKSICEKNNISYTHFDIKKSYTRNKKVWSEEEVYRPNSLFPRAQLRARILKDKLLDYKCTSCGNDGKWNDKKLTLEVEHINGINDDHSKTNITWLCPNCHSQTKTYRNRFNRKGL